MAGEDPTEAEKPLPTIGSYRLVESLGSGGMSSVFRALHVESGVEVAVKVLPRNLARNRTLLQRFLREAKSAEALEHPNIVAIYDHGVDNGQYYLVLEYVDGGDLHDHVRSVGPMSVADAVAVVRTVCEALKFAAGQGLIHRDIKPANLLMSREGTIKVADLGLALQAEDEDERVTREGTTVGTVDYMAPEQARDSRGTSERSDMYSLGCTFFFLLTAQPPFAGGDITEKLTRHFTATPPDPATFRPDVPPELSRLIRKMMGKRPESRYANYDELIAALNAVPLGATPPPGPTETLDVLIDDEEDDDRPVPTYTLVGGAPLHTEPAPLYALFADEDDDDNDPDSPPASDGFLPLDFSEAEAVKPSPAHDFPRLPDVSMAELAALGSEDRFGPPPRSAERQPVRRPPSAPTVPVTAPAQGTLFHEEETALEGKMPGQVSFGSGPKMSAEERAWLKALVLGGVGLFIAVIGFHQLYRATVPDRPGVVEETGPGLDTEASPEPVAPAPAPPVVPVPKPPPRVAAVGKRDVPKQPVSHVPTAPPPPPPWIEPLDPESPSVTEADFGRDVGAKYRPDWAKDDIPSRLPGKYQGVRRLTDPRDSDQKSRLGEALEVIGDGTAEVTDDGPFFENDLRTAGENRLVRARPGYRPIICLQAPRLDVLKQQAAFLELDTRTLTLDGLDLIVDAGTLPRNYRSIFQCRGGSLTLRNCTITLVNRSGLPVSVVRTGLSEKPSRVRLERTLVRGAFASAFDLTEGAADVVVSRSVILNGLGSAVASRGTGALERRVYLTRSVLATRGPAIDLAEPSAGVRTRPLDVRALGNTFARLPSAVRTSLIAWRGEGGTATEMLAWQGDANTFAGWSDWLSVGSAHSVRVLGVAAAHDVWPGTDATSREFPAVRPFPADLSPDRAGPAALRELAPERPDVLSRVAIASPLIHEKTLDAFPRPIVVGLTDPRGVPIPPPVVEIPAVPPVAATPPVAGVRDLAFDTESAPWAGDLGRFIQANLKAGDTLVRVRVTGSGTHVWSPVRVPDGVSLEVTVFPDTGGRVPSWTAARTPAPALLELHGGSLALSRVNLSRDASADPVRLVVVDGGHLLIDNSRLIARGPSLAGGGGLLEFIANGSKPLKAPASGLPAWPFGAPTDRPTCRVTDSVLISEGDVLVSEVGRGLVAFWQCAIASGASAFTLRPGSLARHRFEADLWLDRCTVAAERSFVALGPWPGAEPGPDRPWLVSTQRCAFFGTFDRKAQESVLLRADAESFAHGALFWQTHGDAFEVSHFATARDVPPPSNPRPDLTHQWSDLWGPAHVHSVTGPHPPNGLMTRRLVTHPLRPGDVQPGDLAVDPTFPKDDPPSELGVDLARLGLTPTPRTPRRR